MQNLLKYKNEANTFEEALPIGSGKLGAMVYGKGEVERVSLNFDELWSGKPGRHTRKGAYESYKKAQKEILCGNVEAAERFIEGGISGDWTDMYMPLGNLYIDGLKAVGEDYTRELNMREGIVSVKNGMAERTYFCYNDTLVVRITGESDFNVYLDSQLKYTTYTEGEKYILNGECPTYILSDAQSPTGEGICGYMGDGVHFAAVIAVKTDGRAEYSDKIYISDATDTVITLNVVSSFTSPTAEPNAEYLKPCIDKANAQIDYSALIEQHKKYFSECFDRVVLDLCAEQSEEDTLTRLRAGDKSVGMVELLFNFGRYLVISSSAPGSRATNLQGIWNEQFFPPWNSNYTVNINTQMNYWPVLPVGLTEFYEPMIELIKTLSETGRKTARDFYHADGFCLHHNTDIWGHSTAVGDRKPGSARWGFWNASGGWMCQHLFEYYEYTEDTDFLRSIGYPIMKEAARFYLDILVEYNGMYIITPATSPENAYMLDGRRCCVSKWATMTQAIVEELFINCVKSAEVLGIDDEFVQKLNSVIPKLHPHIIADDGRLLEWEEDFEETDVNHRHVSHLYGLYPGTTITTDATPELAEACKKSLLKRGDDGTGWSLGWKANLWAKLKDGDHALKIIKRQLELVEGEGERFWAAGGTYPNFFDAHPPFQIDGNFGVTAAIVLMLMQCEDGVIKILPALPSDFKSGSVSGLRAKGDICVDITWDNNKAQSVTLTSKRDKTVEMLVDSNKVSVQLKAGEPYKHIA